VTFDFNGQIRAVQIRDLSVKPTKATNRKAVDPNEVGTSLQGKLSAIMVKAGDEVEQNAPLFVIEAMKMETTITAPEAGKVKKLHLHAGELVEQGDLVVEFE
jgi:pyruvate carboxylase